MTEQQAEANFAADFRSLSDKERLEVIDRIAGATKPLTITQLKELEKKETVALSKDLRLWHESQEWAWQITQREADYIYDCCFLWWEYKKSKGVKLRKILESLSCGEEEVDFYDWANRVEQIQEWRDIIKDHRMSDPNTIVEVPVTI